jgi:inner membrane protein
MLGRTHALAGATIGLILAGPVGAGVGVIGALLPDIDHPNSKISRAVKLPLHLAFTHRGVLHSGLLCALVFALAFFASPEPYKLYALAAAAGWISHIVLDALTVSGVPLFWPIRFKLSVLPLRTGGIIEQLLAILLTIALLYQGYLLLYPFIDQFI